MKRNISCMLLASAGVVLIGIGIALGQPGQVMMKAVRICMECVGIG